MKGALTSTEPSDVGLLRRLRLERQLSAGEGESLGFPVPRYLYLRLATSNVCNYRCKHCHIWMNQEPLNALSTARRVDLLGEFSRLAQRGIVEFPGGEVTLAFEELCTLASASERLGLQAGVVSNGSKLQTPGAARRLVDSGLARIMISLDSHEPRLHDYVRGVPGAFEQATRALRLLARARDRPGRARRRPIIQAIAVLFDENIEELGEYVEFCRGLGVESINFQVLNRTFANTNAKRDVFFEKHFWHEPAAKQKAVRALSRVVERYIHDPIVKPGVHDLPWLTHYIEHPETTPHGLVCGAFFRNAIIDTDGDVSLCFNLPAGAQRGSIGNAANTPLERVLGSQPAKQMRDLMRVCNKPCGALECHRAAG